MEVPFIQRSSTPFSVPGFRNKPYRKLLQAALDFVELFLRAKLPRKGILRDQIALVVLLESSVSQQAGGRIAHPLDAAPIVALLDGWRLTIEGFRLRILGIRV